MNLRNNLLKIREYTKIHSELLKSHHFLFNSPLNKDFQYSDAVVIGLNPGETKRDWDYSTNLPTEESHEFDFHDQVSKSRSALRWAQKCRDYLKTDKVTLSEFFFWSSSQTGEDKKKAKPLVKGLATNLKNVLTSPSVRNKT